LTLASSHLEHSGVIFAPKETPFGGGADCIPAWTPFELDIQEV
jgi:hypothetical protein